MDEFKGAEPVTISRGSRPTTLDSLLDYVERLERRIDAKPHLRWGVVTGKAPLRVRLDGDAAELAGLPSALSTPLSIGMRVSVAIQTGQALIVGAASETSGGEIRDAIGPAAKRRGITPRAGDLWTDSDEDKYVWVGSARGVWRRKSGAVTFAAAAWDSASSNIWGRSPTATIPTALDPGEVVLLTTLSVSNGYGSQSQSGVGDSNWVTLTTPVTIRHYQFLNAQTNWITCAWEIIRI